MNLYKRSDIPSDLLEWFAPAEIGLEPTPQDFVDALVAVFREVKRVLKDDGTIWINLGDSYVAAATGSLGNSTGAKYGFTSGHKTQQEACKRPDKTGFGLPIKNLIGIPWRVAFALQADGWYLRQDIIWAKPNPMPESVTDRCTKSHEYIFLLSKGPKYYFDHEAIKEKALTVTQDRKRPNGLSVEEGKKTGVYRPNCGVTEMRNKRDVWTVATKPYKEAHFAIFPPDLIRPCVLAGCPKGGLVLDPFMGAGTSALVAKQEGRNYVGFELNPEYIKIANRRIHGELFAEVQ